MKLKHCFKLALLVSFLFLLCIKSSAIQDITPWWLSASPTDGLVSMLSSQTQSHRNKILDASKQESITIEGSHYIETLSSSSSFEEGYSTSVEKNTYNATRVVFKNSVTSTTYDTYLASVETVRADRTASVQSAAYFVLPAHYYSYIEGDWSLPATYKFKIKSNFLPIGKIYAVVQIAPVGDRQLGQLEWTDSAIIPLYIERDNACVFGAIYDNYVGSTVNPTPWYGKSPWDKSQTLTWKASATTSDESQFFINGYFLSGQLDGDLNKQSVQEIRMSIDVPGYGTITGGDKRTGYRMPISAIQATYDPSLPNFIEGLFDVDSTTDSTYTTWCTKDKINTRFSSMNYTYTQSDVLDNSNRHYNVGFVGSFGLKKSDIEDMNKNRKGDRQGTFKISVISNTGKELFSDSRNIKLDFTDTSTVISNDLPYGDFTKPAYQYRIYEDKVEFDTDWASFRSDNGLTAPVYNTAYSVYFGTYLLSGAESVNINVYGFILSGSKDKLIPNNPNGALTCFVPNSGQSFPYNISYIHSLGANKDGGDFDSVFWNTYIPKTYNKYQSNNSDKVDTRNVKFDYVLPLSINAIRDRMSAAEKSQNVKEIPIQVTATIADVKKPTQTSKYTIEQKVYLIKKATPASSTSPIATTIYTLGSGTEEWDTSYTQTIDEGALTDSTTSHRTLTLSGNIKVPAVTAKNKSFKIIDIMAASNVLGSSKLMPAITPIWNVTTMTYSFSTTLEVPFEKITSGKKTVSIRIRAQNNDNGLIVPSTESRIIKIVKLGDGRSLKPLYAIDSPAKNTTLVLPAVTNYNKDSVISIPVSGIFLDGTFSGVEKADIYLGKNLINTLTDFATIDQSTLDSTYGNKGYKTTFGYINRDRFNVRFNTTITTSNSSDLLKTGANLITAIVKTYNGKTYTVKSTIKVKRFSDLHKPTVTIKNVGASVIFSVYDVDLDLKTVQYKLSSSNVSLDNSGWTRLNTSPSSVTVTDSNRGQADSATITKVSNSKYIYIKAIDQTGRIIYKKGTFKP